MTSSGGDTPPFRVPRDGYRYYENVTERAQALITSGIWEGLDVARLRGWLRNFRSDEERYFSACLLDRVVYRSEKQTLSLIKQLFQRVLPDLARSDLQSPPSLVDLQEKLSTSSAEDPKVRLVAVTKQFDPPGKSSDIILRHIQRDLQINRRFTIRPSAMKEAADAGVSTFVFVDDFLGSGHQFESLIHHESLHGIIASCCCLYCPLAAHVQGVQYLASKFPSLTVRAVEALDGSHEVFNPLCACFEDAVNSPASAAEFYYNLLADRGIPLQGCDRRGYGDLQLLYAFQHAVPDNCLPILWWNAPESWRPLFLRSV